MLLISGLLTDDPVPNPSEHVVDLESALAAGWDIQP